MIKDQEEITNQSNKIISSTQLSNNNLPKALVKASFVSPITNVTTDILDAKFVAKSEFTKSEVVEFDND